MKTQSEGAIFVSVSERKFHFIAVTEFHRASMDAFPAIVCVFQCCVQKLPDLAFLHFQLFFIGHGLVHTAATFRKNGTGRVSGFLRRFLQNFQQTSFCPAGTLFVDHKTDLLSGNAIFDSDLLISYHHSPFVGKIYFFNCALIYFAFFHK